MRPFEALAPSMAIRNDAENSGEMRDMIAPQMSSGMRCR
jgi:hypothetical protein